MQEKLNQAIALLSTPLENISIGIQKEKILHKIIKYYLISDPKCHEVKIGKIYADVVIDNHIYEIQTQNFNMLRKKLDYLLPNYKVTIVYPTCHVKQIYNINEQGELLKTSKSPKKGTPFQVLIEMYKIRSYLSHPNLSFKILYLDIDEFREITPKKHYHAKGYVRFKQVPTKIINEYNLITFDDYLHIFEEYAFLNEFTTLSFSKCFKVSKAKASPAILALESLGIVEESGKEGRKKLWKIKKSTT